MPFLTLIGMDFAMNKGVAYRFFIGSILLVLLTNPARAVEENEQPNHHCPLNKLVEVDWEQSAANLKKQAELKSNSTHIRVTAYIDLAKLIAKQKSIRNRYEMAMANIKLAFDLAPDSAEANESAADIL